MLTPYLIVIGIFLLLLLLIRYSFRSRSKNGDDTGRYSLFSVGDSGEYAVARQLRRLPHEYLVINDLLLSNGKGHTTQIDHVVISPYGIFVIETKNISGNIYGSSGAQKWKRYLNTWWHGIQRTHHLEFNNPIMQNEAHIEVLKRILSEFEQVEPVSIIAFSPKAELHVKADDSILVYWSGVRRCIKRYKSPMLTKEESNRIYEYLRTINIKDRNTRRNHAAQAQQNQILYTQRVRQAIEQGICPKCGGKIIRRQGQYGAFYGCSNYPNCKFTQQI